MGWTQGCLKKSEDGLGLHPIRRCVTLRGLFGLSGTVRCTMHCQLAVMHDTFKCSVFYPCAVIKHTTFEITLSSVQYNPGFDHTAEKRITTAEKRITTAE